jgi:hypothetical protein
MERRRKAFKRVPITSCRGAKVQMRKKRKLQEIEAKARREAAYLAGEFARAASAEKEEILAALELERWLAQSCREVLDHGELMPKGQS